VYAVDALIGSWRRLAVAGVLSGPRASYDNGHDRPDGSSWRFEVPIGNTGRIRSAAVLTIARHVDPPSRSVGLVTLGLGGALLIALLLPSAPIVAYAIAAGPALLVLMTARPWVLALLAVASTWISRVLTTTGFAPRMLDFADFGLVAFALFTAVVTYLSGDRRLSTDHRRVVRAVALLAAAIVISSIVNAAPPERMVAGLLLTMQPFMLLVALLLAPPPHSARRIVIGFIAVVCAVQIPIAVMQSLGSTNPDDVKGTLFETGAGHHVMAGGLMVGLFVALAVLRHRPTLIVIFLSVAAVGVLADAKQVMFPAPFAFVIATVAVGVGGLSLRQRASRVVLVLAGFAVILFTFAPVDAAFDMINRTTNTGGGKPALTVAMVDDLTASPLQGVFGFGPGETVSRFAHLTSSDETNANPVETIGLEPGSLTEYYDDLVQGAGYVGDSSFASAQSSLLGVVGDYGLLGLLAMGWLLFTMMSALKRLRTPMAQAALASWILVVPLAYLFDWLEQPPFMLLVALVSAVALTETVPDPSDHRAEPLGSVVRHQLSTHRRFVGLVALLCAATALVAAAASTPVTVAVARLLVVDSPDRVLTLSEIPRPSVGQRVRHADALSRSEAYVQAADAVSSVDHDLSVVVESDAIEIRVQGPAGQAEELAESHAEALLSILRADVERAAQAQLAVLESKQLAIEFDEGGSTAVERANVDRQVRLQQRRDEILARRSQAVAAIRSEDAVSISTEPVLPLGQAGVLGAGLGALWAMGLVVVRILGRERVYSEADVLRLNAATVVLPYGDGTQGINSPSVQTLAFRSLQLGRRSGRAASVAVLAVGPRAVDTAPIADAVGRTIARLDPSVTVDFMSDVGDADPDGVVLTVDVGHTTADELEHALHRWAGAGTDIVAVLLHDPGNLHTISPLPSETHA
jgi:hypothetical protein